MPLFGLFAHPLFDLLAQVVHVVLCHQHLDAVHELLGRARRLGDDGVLFDEVDRQVELVDSDPVADIPIEAVGLLNEDRAA
ncbi:MAG: hypothetical protein A3H29_05615 [Acidobacteria bacterium RIFCSPLOWO2_02_FULL_67_21]|nr:MAG: hypothetical protein A3H29_05615 [Acidobacteria bacterium RIFCSPLOWO2_02_FULL_67_21]